MGPRHCRSPCPSTLIQTKHISSTPSFSIAGGLIVHLGSWLLLIPFFHMFEYYMDFPTSVRGSRCAIVLPGCNVYRHTHLFLESTQTSIIGCSVETIVQGERKLHGQAWKGIKVGMLETKTCMLMLSYHSPHVRQRKKDSPLNPTSGQAACPGIVCEKRPLVSPSHATPRTTVPFPHHLYTLYCRHEPPRPEKAPPIISQ